MRTCNTYHQDKRFILENGVVIAKTYDVANKCVAMKNAGKITVALNSVQSMSEEVREANKELAKVSRQRDKIMAEYRDYERSQEEL